MLAVTAAAVMVSGCGGGQENQVSSNDPSVEQAFESAKTYWRDHSVGAVANTRLVTLANPGDTFYCTPASQASTQRNMATKVLRYSSGPIAYYCGGQDTIVVNGKNLESEVARVEPDGISPQSFIAYVVAHELGHGIANTTGYAPEARESEFRADCYAGAALSGMGILEIPQLAESSLLRGHGLEHATGDERTLAFNTGVQNPDGKRCSNYYNPAD